MKKLLITGGSGFIGKNLIEIIKDEKLNYDIINIDKKEDGNSNCIFIKCDILDKENLNDCINDVNPNYIIHLAAQTDCDANLQLDDYKVNYDGSKNVFDISSGLDSLDGLIHISTQFVNQSDFPLLDFYIFKPNLIYGESKMLSEKLLIEGDYDFNWVILRPTNVWGKWHPRYPSEFWKILKDGKYFHPYKKGVIRSYGYVGNVCNQILFFLKNINKNSINNQIFYVGDEPIELYEWVNKFSLKLKGKNVKIVPSFIIYILALFGSLIEKLNFTFPITISRYKNMTKSNPAPMKKTLKLLSEQKFSLDQGVDLTVRWLNENKSD